MRGIVAFAAVAVALIAPSLARAETCEQHGQRYTHMAVDAALPANGRTNVYMQYARLKLSHEYDHTHGTFAVDPMWPHDQNPDPPFIEGGVGIFGHRRGIPWDREPKDGIPDPIVWASYEPPAPGIQLQFSFEGWADPNVLYRFEIIRVGPGDMFRMWINGLESNLTWYGGGAKEVPGADRVTLYGEDNSANDSKCDEFDIGFSGLNPPMTRYLGSEPGAPWASCFNSLQPPWYSGEFWLASSPPSYASGLCCPVCYSPFTLSELDKSANPLLAPVDRKRSSDRSRIRDD